MPVLTGVMASMKMVLPAGLRCVSTLVRACNKDPRPESPPMFQPWKIIYVASFAGSVQVSGVSKRN